MANDTGTAMNDPRYASHWSCAWWFPLQAPLCGLPPPAPTPTVRAPWRCVRPTHGRGLKTAWQRRARADASARGLSECTCGAGCGAQCPDRLRTRAPTHTLRCRNRRSTRGRRPCSLPVAARPTTCLPERHVHRHARHSQHAATPQSPRVTRCCGMCRCVFPCEPAPSSPFGQQSVCPVCVFNTASHAVRLLCLMHGQNGYDQGGTRTRNLHLHRLESEGDALSIRPLGLEWVPEMPNPHKTTQDQGWWCWCYAALARWPEVRNFHAATT